MPKSPNKKQTSITRSSRLRKYEAAYEAYLKKTKSPNKKPVKETNKSPNKKSTKRTRSRRKTQQTGFSLDPLPVKETRRRSKTEKRIKSKDRKRPLNNYQKFVREESKNPKYNGMSAAERMTAISKVWNNIKG